MSKCSYTCYSRPWRKVRSVKVKAEMLLKCLNDSPILKGRLLKHWDKVDKLRAKPSLAKPANLLLVPVSTPCVPELSFMKSVSAIVSTHFHAQATKPGSLFQTDSPELSNKSLCNCNAPSLTGASCVCWWWHNPSRRYNLLILTGPP